MIATEGGHWYALDGTPAYEVVGKNGAMRNTTLRDARKLNLVPSVTMIMNCAAAPALENWKRNQLLMSALTLPRLPEEGTQAFADRIIADSQAQAVAARDLGSAIHGCIEKRLMGQTDIEFAEHVQGAITSLDDWCGCVNIRPEKSFAHPIGFGGKCDVHKNGFVADFKTKDFDENNLPATYDNHAMQLAAYREGFGLTHARGAIIYVSTKIPGLTHLVEVSQDELDRGWEMFQALLTYWQKKNRFSPALTEPTMETV